MLSRDSNFLIQKKNLINFVELFRKTTLDSYNLREKKSIYRCPKNVKFEKKIILVDLLW